MLISIDGFDRILTRIGANKNRIDRLFLLSTQSNKSGANVALDMRSGILSAQIIGFPAFTIIDIGSNHPNEQFFTMVIKWSKLRRFRLPNHKFIIARTDIFRRSASITILCAFVSFFP